MTILKTVADKDKALGPLFAAPEKDDLSSNSYRLLIGCLGSGLPLLLWIGAGCRPIKELQPWALLDSVSAYYYTGAIAVFVGILAALGAFLVTYRGSTTRTAGWTGLQELSRASRLLAWRSSQQRPRTLR